MSDKILDTVAKLADDNTATLAAWKRDGTRDTHFLEGKSEAYRKVIAAIAELNRETVTCPKCRGYGVVGPQSEPGCFTYTDNPVCSLCAGERRVAEATGRAYEEARRNEAAIRDGVGPMPSVVKALRCRFDALKVVNEGHPDTPEMRHLRGALAEFARLHRLAHNAKETP